METDSEARNKARLDSEVMARMKGESEVMSRMKGENESRLDNETITQTNEGNVGVNATRHAQPIRRTVPVLKEGVSSHPSYSQSFPTAKGTRVELESTHSICIQLQQGHAVRESA